MANKNVHPIDKPDGKLSKSSIFWNSSIGKIIIGLITGLIVLTIGWFIKFYLDGKHGLLPTQAIHGIDTTKRKVDTSVKLGADSVKKL